MLIRFVSGNSVMKRIILVVVALVLASSFVFSLPARADVANFIGLCLQETNCELQSTDSTTQLISLDEYVECEGNCPSVYSTAQAISSTELGAQLQQACESELIMAKYYQDDTAIGDMFYMGKYSQSATFGKLTFTTVRFLSDPPYESEEYTNNPPSYVIQQCADTGPITRD